MMCDCSWRTFGKCASLRFFPSPILRMDFQLNWLESKPKKSIHQNSLHDGSMAGFYSKIKQAKFLCRLSICDDVFQFWHVKQVDAEIAKQRHVNQRVIFPGILWRLVGAIKQLHYKQPDTRKRFVTIIKSTDPITKVVTLKKFLSSSHQATHSRTTLRIVCKKFHIVYKHWKKKSLQGASEAMTSNKLQNQIPARDEKWVPDVYLCPDYDQADVDIVIQIFRDLGKLHSKLLCKLFHIHLMPLYTLTKRIVYYTTEFLWWWRPTPWAFTRFWVRGIKAIPTIQFIENKINERELYETEFHLA